jgi:hypothetical protein
MRTTLEDRLFARVVQEGEDNIESCWLWHGCRNGKGYGHIRVGDKMRGVHRVAWELFFGEIPVGLELDHLCLIENCINPFHLEPVTTQVNLARKDAARSRTRKSHCKRGHELSVAARPRSDGQRECSQCVYVRGLHR